MKTWEVTLETSSGIITKLVEADDWDTHSTGLILYTSPDDRKDVAFFPLSRLVGIVEKKEGGGEVEP